MEIFLVAVVAALLVWAMPWLLSLTALVLMVSALFLLWLCEKLFHAPDSVQKAPPQRRRPGPRQ